MTHDETFIRRCIALSEEAVRQGDEPFGALLVVDGEVRCTARNQVLTESDPTRHAELLLAFRGTPATSAHDSPKSTSIVVPGRTLRCT